MKRRARSIWATDSIGSVTLAAQAMAQRLNTESFYAGVEFYYEFLKELTAGRS